MRKFIVGSLISVGVALTALPFNAIHSQPMAAYAAHVSDAVPCFAYKANTWDESHGGPGIMPAGGLNNGLQHVDFYRAPGQPATSYIIDKHMPNRLNFLGYGSVWEYTPACPGYPQSVREIRADYVSVRIKAGYKESGVIAQLDLQQHKIIVVLDAKHIGKSAALKVVKNDLKKVTGLGRYSLVYAPIN